MKSSHQKESIVDEMWGVIFCRKHDKKTNKIHGGEKRAKMFCHNFGQKALLLAGSRIVNIFQAFVADKLIECHQ